jgi:hypothetical protein
MPKLFLISANSCGETEVWIWSIMLVTESKTNIKRPDATRKKVNATNPLQEVDT